MYHDANNRTCQNVEYWNVETPNCCPSHPPSVSQKIFDDCVGVRLGLCFRKLSKSHPLCCSKYITDLSVAKTNRRKLSATIKEYQYYIKRREVNVIQSKYSMILQKETDTRKLKESALIVEENRQKYCWF